MQTSKIDNTDGIYVSVYNIDRSELYNPYYGAQNEDMKQDPEMLFALHKYSDSFHTITATIQYSVTLTNESILLNRLLRADYTFCESMAV